MVLVKFDETYPYGDAQDAFKAVAEASIDQENMLLTEVHVAGRIESSRARASMG